MIFEFPNYVELDFVEEIKNKSRKYINFSSNHGSYNREGHTVDITAVEDLKELDYIGQLENMEEVAKILSEILSEEINFSSIRYKGAVNDYYSIKIDIDKFNKLYMEDYETLNKFYKPLNRSSFSNF